MIDPRPREHFGESLEVPVDEARLARGWRAISEATYAPSRRPLYAGAAVVTAAAAIAIAIASRGEAGPGPLATVTAGAPVSVEHALGAAGRAGGSVALDDGSTIAIAQGASLEPLENTAERFSLLLHAGTARFDVRPGGPRRWSIEAGLVTVEVVGTAFEVRREGGAVRVSVSRGRVLVRGESVPDRVRALGAGESIEIGAEDAELAAGEITDDEIAAGETGAAAELPGGAEVAEGASPIASRARRADAVPAEAATPDVATLLAQADEARRAGRIDDALAGYAAAARHEGDPQAALASFTRGRLALDHGRAADAVTDLHRALALGLPPALEETARARLVDALARTGDAAGARRAADEYLEAYPEGAWRGSVSRALDP